MSTYNFMGKGVGGFGADAPCSVEYQHNPDSYHYSDRHRLEVSIWGGGFFNVSFAFSFDAHYGRGTTSHYGPTSAFLSDARLRATLRRIWKRNVPRKEML